MYTPFYIGFNSRYGPYVHLGVINPHQYKNIYCTINMDFSLTEYGVIMTGFVNIEQCQIQYISHHFYWVEILIYRKMK